MKKTLMPRDRELVIIAGRINREASADGVVLTLEQLAEKVRQCRPLHFYYDYERSCRMMNLIRRVGRDRFNVSTDIRAGWLDLYDQVEEMRTLRPKLNANQALVQVLMFRRPARVYLATGTIRKILAPHFGIQLTEKPINRA